MSGPRHLERLHDDRPIELPEDDRLSRWPFAQSLHRLLILDSDHPSVVVGIEGAWGSGKTSLLNLIGESLRRSGRDPIVIRLDSWQILREGDPVAWFLSELAFQLGNHSPRRTAAAVRRLSALAGSFRKGQSLPVVGLWASVVALASEGAAAALQNRTLRVHRLLPEAARAIEKVGRPIVVLVDDLDRLDGHEIASLFRVVKAIASFDGIAYVLAFDPDHIVAELSTLGISNGRAFLEKIVQLQYPVPVPDYGLLCDLFEAGLADITSDLPLAPFEVERFEYLKFHGVLRGLRHLRDKARLLNRLRVSVPATRGEVNAADVVAFEILALRFPDIVEVVRRDPYSFVGSSKHPHAYVEDLARSVARQGQASRPGDTHFIHQVSASLPATDQDLARAILSFLFPTMDRETSAFEGPPADLRIHRAGPLHCLLRVGGHSPAHVPASELRSFLEKPEARLEILSGVVARPSAQQWLWELPAFSRNIQVREPQQLLEVVEEVAAKLASRSADPGELDPDGLIRSLAPVVLVLLDGSESRSSADWLQRHPSMASLSLWEEMLVTEARDRGLWRDGRSSFPETPTPEQRLALDLVHRWLTAVRQRAATAPLELLAEPGLVGVLFRWGQFGFYDEVRDFLRIQLRKQPALRQFARGLERSGGLRGIELLVDLEELRGAVSREPSLLWLAERLASYDPGVTGG